MTRLVLDLSVLVALTKQEIDDLSDQYEFLLTEKAIEELYTSRCDDCALSLNAEARAYAMLSKLKDRHVVEPYDPFRFEVENGRSSIHCQYINVGIPDDCPLVSAHEAGSMCQSSGTMSKLWDFEHPREHEATFLELRKTAADEALFPCISDNLHTDNMQRLIQSIVIDKAAHKAKKENWTVSSEFHPDRHWVTYGCEAACFAGIIYKYARHGDQSPAKAANLSYDLIYIAHMAICDGILSLDHKSGLLPMAWACWPEKRHNIWTYDKTRHCMVRYSPPWQS